MFEPLDLSKLRAKLKIDQTSIQEGRRDLPSESDRDLDAHQTEIVQHLGEMLDKARVLAINEIQTILAKLGELDARIRARPFVQECQDLLSQFHSKTSSLESERRPRLERLRVAERRLLRNLNFFRAENNLNHEAHYPDSRIFHWAIIIGMIVFESLTNAYFFAEGSALGFAGGWLQSIIVSLLVILSSAKLIGSRAIPLLNHARSKWVVIGALLLVLYIFLLFAFSLLVAHYRLLLTIDPDNALIQTLPHYLATPFTLDPVSWTFFGVSVVFGLSAVIAGYTSDDKYPGYGALDRRYKEAEREYVKSKDELTAEITRLHDEAFGNVSRLILEAQGLIYQRKMMIPRVKSLDTEYTTYASNVQQTCNTLLREYRDRNRKVRTAPVPTYFNEEYSYKDRSTLGVPNIGEGVEMNTEYEKVLTQLLKKATEVRAGLQTSVERRQSGLRSLYSEAETAALATLSEDSRLGR